MHWGTFDYAHFSCDIAKPHPGIFGGAQQNVRVISDKGPVVHLLIINFARCTYMQLSNNASHMVSIYKWAIHVSAVVVPVPDQRAFAEWGPASGGPAVESARGVAERHGRSSVSAASVPGHSRAPGGCPTRPVGCGLATSAL